MDWYHKEVTSKRNLVNMLVLLPRLLLPLTSILAALFVFIFFIGWWPRKQLFCIFDLNSSHSTTLETFSPLFICSIQAVPSFQNVFAKTLHCKAWCFRSSLKAVQNPFFQLKIKPCMTLTCLNFTIWVFKVHSCTLLSVKVSNFKEFAECQDGLRLAFSLWYFSGAKKLRVGRGHQMTA